MARFVVLAADGKTILTRGHAPDDDVNIQPVPVGASLMVLAANVPTPADNQEFDPNTQKFVVNLVSVKKIQASVVKSGMDTYIQAGFVSNAKTVGLIYDSSVEERLNMSMSAATPNGGMIWCKVNINGIFIPVSHTQAQARGVVQDFITYRDAAFSQFATLGNAIRNAASVAAVLAIVWTPP